MWEVSHEKPEGELFIKESTVFLRSNASLNTDHWV